MAIQTLAASLGGKIAATQAPAPVVTQTPAPVQQAAPQQPMFQPAPQAAPVQAPVQQQPQSMQPPYQQPAPQPQQPMQQPAGVPVSAPVAPAPQYTLEQLGVAAGPLLDAGRGPELTAWLQSKGVQALTHLDKALYGEFALYLRSLGARI
ncbi:hypothetical protein [Desulfitobacterium hafniense]|nr:hypothetical protein [Desulfitobacterium hafniense]